jgi:hypothetical protein
MAAQTRVHVIRETPSVHDGQWQLRLQWCRYLHPNGAMQYGYRFIWLRADGRLATPRGQTRLPSLNHVTHLFYAAKAGGWGDFNGDLMA